MYCLLSKLFCIGFDNRNRNRNILPPITCGQDQDGVSKHSSRDEQEGCAVNEEEGRSLCQGVWKGHWREEDHLTEAVLIPSSPAEMQYLCIWSLSIKIWSLSIKIWSLSINQLLCPSLSISYICKLSNICIVYFQNCFA